MIVEFDKSFEKAINKINDDALLLKVESWITLCYSKLNHGF